MKRKTLNPKNISGSNTPKTEALPRTPDLAITDRSFQGSSSLVPPQRGVPLSSVQHNGIGSNGVPLNLGRYPFVELIRNEFFINKESLGIEFHARIFILKNAMIFKPICSGDIYNAILVWKDDRIITRNGGLWSNAMISHFESTGHECFELIAEIQSGSWAGRLVLIDIEPEAKLSFIAYQERLERERKLRIPKVITRVSLADPVSSKTNKSLPWCFDFVQVISLQ